MNKYDEIYIFRLATLNDIDDIMNFIKMEWKEDHILATDKDFFYYEFVHGNNVNFMLAINKETKKIDGIGGFIQNSISTENADIWGAILKVRSIGIVPFLGIEILKRSKLKLKARSWSAVGINPKTLLPLVAKFFNQKTGKLNHFYRLSDLECYSIANIKKKRILSLKEKEKNYELIIFNDFDKFTDVFNIESFKNKQPYKDEWYIKKRYFKHPIYSYKVFGIKNEDNLIDSILIGREIKENGAKILRIVDFIGQKDDLNYIGKEIQELIDQNNYEYIDFYCYGISEIIMENAGFICKEESDENIIPNYFEPFLKKNINIWFEIPREDMLVCKADGDQDRPNFR